MRLPAALLAALLLAGCARDVSPGVATPEDLTPTPSLTSGTPTAGPPLALAAFLTGFTKPILLTHDEGDPDATYVVEQGGRIWRIVGDDRTIWLDVSGDVLSGGERGLLGLAFEPGSDRAYIDYTNAEGDAELQRIHGDGTRETLLVIADPYPNHNGGGLAFGPDGHLYFGMGDGGSGGDPEGNGQDPAALLGSMLRLDVTTETGAAPAAGNPWKEAWAKGLRNPWRFSFDRVTGDLYIGDVGQNKYEEIDFLAKSAPAGANFGWNIFEGNHRYSLVGEPFSSYTPPVAEYSHDDGCSVTGGYVYRGGSYPSLTGVYLFGDYCSGKIWGMREKEGAWRVVELLDTDLAISSFGEDAAGELYVVDHGGAIHRLVGGGPVPDALR